MDPATLASFWKAFPSLDPADPALRSELAPRPLVQWKSGTTLVREGDDCAAAPMVLVGSLQVCKLTAEGRQIKLYGIEPGEFCPLTTAAVMGGDAFPATVSVEADTRAVLIPAALFLSLVGRSASFRQLAFGQYARRLAAVIELVDALAFRRLDERLSEFLVKHQTNRRVNLTHQEIADRLGTSREVISRLLGEFEAGGRLVTHRGSLELTGL